MTGAAPPTAVNGPSLESKYITTTVGIIRTTITIDIIRIGFIATVTGIIITIGDISLGAARRSNRLCQEDRHG
jgi:hypothetical protein